MREPKVLKRFYSDTFAPPSGFHSDVRGPEVTAEEILAGGVRESDWSFPVLISTPSQDRQGDVVIPEGCHPGPFASSPCIFFEHQDLKFSIGKMRGPDGRLYFCVVPGKGILGRIWIRQPRPDDPPGYAEACKTVWILVRDGLLNGISAGFDPIGHVKELRGGGNEYKTWELLEVSLVNIAANRECRVLREPFSWDDAILKRFSPSVIKGLKTMTASVVHKGQHHNTRDIRFKNGKWELLDNKTRKVLSTHDTRADALGALRAIEMGKHEDKSTGPAAAKGMSESSGTAGGYTVPEEHKAMCGEIAKRMDENDAAGHELYLHPGSGEVRHVHPGDAKDEHVQGIAADLHDVPGLKSLTQSAEHPKEDEGFHKIYPCKDMGGSVEEGCKVTVEKRARQLSAVGKALYRMIQKRKINGWVRKSLELTVRRTMPTLLKSEMPEKRAVSVAWGIAAVKKGFAPLVVKDAADGDSDPDEEEDTRDDAEDMADDAAADAAMDVPEEEAEGGPDGLELVQTAIENLEAALPKLEPERREFWAGIIDQIKKHGEETYPDEDFGGEDTEGEEGAAAGDDNDAEEQKISDEMLARYKSYRPVRVKRVSIVKIRKSFQQPPETADAIRKAANHLHEIGDMHGDFDEKTGECKKLKGYTLAHHRGCRKMARELDRVHGAIAKSDVQASDAAQGADSTAVTKSHKSDDAVSEVEKRAENVANRLHSILGIRA